VGCTILFVSHPYAVFPMFPEIFARICFKIFLQNVVEIVYYFSEFDENVSKRALNAKSIKWDLNGKGKDGIRWNHKNEV
jgi:hypothetical protein